LLASTGYAADGLRNLMVTLEKQQKNSPPSRLSSHPGGKEQVSDIENLISRNGYNRYPYERVGHHAEIKA
jgi:predicted Zn-dependent protease